MKRIDIAYFTTHETHAYNPASMPVPDPLEIGVNSPCPVCIVSYKLTEFPAVVLLHDFYVRRRQV